MHTNECSSSIHLEQVVVDADVSVTYDILCAEAAAVCPYGWNKVCVSHDYVSFGKIDIINGQMLVTVSVSISKDMKVQVFHKGVPAAIWNCSEIKSRQQLDAVFQRVDMSHECPGNADKHLLKAVSKSRIGILNFSGVWRHSCCTQLTVESVRCIPCRKLRRILKAAALRKNVVKKLRRQALRLRTVHRLQKRVAFCRLMATRLNHQLKSARGQKLDELIKDLPPNQQLAVKHCFRQLSVRSPKGMRYDHQWILGCILLRIKSPKAYAYLRDHCFLSLPSPSTLTRYIDVVHVETGISTEMIDILSNKVKTAPDRHGILIFDEIYLRQGMRFSSKVLEFAGLVDFSEFTPSAQWK